MGSAPLRILPHSGDPTSHAAVFVLTPPLRIMVRDGKTLKGVLERIIFFNEENHYCIAEFRPESDREKVTVTGVLPGVQCGETLQLQGDWVCHPQHGDQFRIASFRSELPSSLYGIRKYLGSGLIPGVGKVYANKIVDQFGTDTLRVISEESALLRKVPGIGKARAAAIKKAWDEQQSLREVLVFLQTYGVSTSQCLRLVDRYGTEARQVLTQEPYRVAREIDGIGFRTADKIAINLGYANDSPPRLDAGLVFALQVMEEEGHTACSEPELLQAAGELLEAPAERLRLRVEALVEAGELARVPQPGGSLLQLPATARAEVRAAAALARLLRSPSGLPAIRIGAAVEWAQQKAGFTFGAQQETALRDALANKVSILTGGPGTGKTTILRALVQILRAKQVRVHLAAPTGRAAQRLAETTGGFAQTIHRLLKFDPAKGGFTAGESAPLNTQYLIVDEASMLDTRLAAGLLQAVPSAAHLLLVGDTDQLPSVGAGAVLADLIASQAIPVTRLSLIYRQQQQSRIVTVAHAINQGNAALPPTAPDAKQMPDSDLVFLPVSSPEACLACVLEMASRVLPASLPNRDSIGELQILAPMHKGIAGVANFNQQLQQALNPAGRSLSTPTGEFRVGDKLIQLRNNYDKGIFNGDIGRVVAVDPEERTLTADFDGERHVFSRGEFADLALAYAISIHKSQGSEYPVVIIPLLKQHFMMLQRNLLYTAITRGKRRVFVVGDPAAYAMAVRNGESKQRWTHLREKLAQALA